MEEYILNVVGHSADLKTVPTGSKDTGIFFPQDLIDFLGSTENYSFIIYREDCAQAMASILSALPLYSNKGGKRITHTSVYDEAIRLTSLITNYFGNNESALYEGPYLSQTTGGRRYLYGLEQNGFSIRKFLVADHSTIIFRKNDDGKVSIRFQTKILPLRNTGTTVTNSVKHTIDLRDSFIVQLLTAIRTKPFILLAGISGTGKSRIVRKLAQATDTIGTYADDAARFACHKPENFCLIQVKPNWHNSMDVVGYKSNIGKNGEHYEYTDFIDFIAKAWQHPDVPFFLCLDEMNLAPVEEYFAEFLSAIESRSIDADGNYETDPIVRPFKEFGDDVCKQMIAHLLGAEPDSDLAEQFRTKGLTLPKNLIVMGTVNMDETTFSFSRKVLDRAMSIEMNEVDYDAFLEGSTEMDVPVLVADNQLLIDRAIKAQDVKDNIDAEAVKDFLNSVNNVLDGTPFKLGYRAANEAMLYVSAAKDFGNDNLAAALDEFTLMKILSRIEGDDSKLRTMLGENLLDELQKLFLEGPLGTLTSSKTLAKLDQMIKSLERDHFVSFWG